MNEQNIVLTDLISVLSDEDLIRVRHRLRKANKHVAAHILGAELSLRSSKEPEAALGAFCSIEEQE